MLTDTPRKLGSPFAHNPETPSTAGADVELTFAIKIFHWPRSLPQILRNVHNGQVFVKWNANADYQATCLRKPKIWRLPPMRGRFTFVKVSIEKLRRVKSPTGDCL